MVKRLPFIIAFSLLLLVIAVTAYADLVNQYDPNGNLITGDGKYYEYNDANQLKKVRNGDQNGPIISEYYYDYTGKRVKKIDYDTSGSCVPSATNTCSTTTYYIGKHYETNVVAGSATNTSYFFADGERVAKKYATGTYFYHPDHLGGTNVITDSNRNVVARNTYLPFGDLREGGAEKFSYTGKEKDKVTDLYYFDARYNNPDLRHFTQADVAEPDLDDPQDLNRYAYVGNNPLSYVDPDGHKKKHHSKKEEKQLAKARAAANAQKKANKKAEEKQRAAADYAKHHPGSSGPFSERMVQVSTDILQSSHTGSTLAVKNASSEGMVLGASTQQNDTICTEQDSPAHSYEVGNLLYIHFEPQDNVCSSPADLLNSSYLAKQCCVAHDNCYAENYCNWSSWLNINAWRACQWCNAKAAVCVLGALALEGNSSHGIYPISITK